MWHTRSTLFIICGSTLLFVMCILVRPSLVHIASFTIEHDVLFNQSACDILNAWIICNKEVAQQPSYFCDQLRKAFPWVRDVALMYLPNNCLWVSIQGFTPQCVVNNKWVITDEHTILAHKIYDSCVLKILPSFYIQQVPTTQSDLIAIAQRCCDCVARSLFNDYVVEWFDELCIHLHDKDNPQFTLVCNEQVLLNETLRSYCECIKQEYMHNEHKKMHDKKWLIDIRFKDQIIVSSDKGGCSDGALIC